MATSAGPGSMFAVICLMLRLIVVFKSSDDAVDLRLQPVL